jgi:CPA2 family monovalent cation:H+ antiporter-2
MARQDHVIICGYGRSGQNLARLLKPKTSCSSRSIRTRSGRVRPRAREQRRVRRRGPQDALSAAGIVKARALVITFADTAVAMKTPSFASGATGSRLVVRTLDDTELDQLLTAGAAEVVPGGSREPHAATHSLLCSACR